jgi:hypothetical protein
MNGCLGRRGKSLGCAQSASLPIGIGPAENPRNEALGRVNLQAHRERAQAVARSRGGALDAPDACPEPWDKNTQGCDSFQAPTGEIGPLT